MREYFGFSVQLEKHLVSQNRSISWLAKQLGVHSSTVSRWASGISRPSKLEIIIRTAEILNLTLAETQKLLTAAGYDEQFQASLPNRFQGSDAFSRMSTTYNSGENFTGEEKFEIITAGGHRIILDDLDQKIILSSSDGNILIILDDQAMKISLESAGEIEVNAVGDINLNANANIDIQANGTVNVKGAVINLN